MSSTKIFLGLMLAVWLGLGALSLRFEPPEFRPWEILYDPGTQRFTPNARLEMTSVGDLGHESWIRARQIRRHVVFTTDEWGFRNPTRIEHPEVVLLGDSFVVGSALSDDQTLSVQLTKRLGTPVYNFGTEELNSPRLYLREERFARVPPKVVVYAPVSRTLRPHRLFPPPRDEAAPSLARALFRRYEDTGALVQRRTDAIERDNGLTHRARYLYNGLKFSVFGYARERFVDGGWALTLGVVDQNLAADPVGERYAALTIRMLKGLSDLLGERGTLFVFCPIPESATIYPEIFPAEEVALIRDPSYLDLVIEGARAKGVDVVDLRPLYRASKTPYLYLRDDSHWAPRCVELTADALAGALRASGALSAD